MGRRGKDAHSFDRAVKDLDSQLRRIVDIVCIGGQR